VKPVYVTSEPEYVGAFRVREELPVEPRLPLHSRLQLEMPLFSETLVNVNALRCPHCDHLPKRRMRSVYWTKEGEKTWFLDILVLRVDASKEQRVECQWCAHRFGDVEPEA